MSFTAEVTGGKADRFRAYVKGPMTRKPRVTDHVARAEDGKKPFKPGDRVEYEVEHVGQEGSVSGSSVSISSTEVVERVVFYAGPVEEEVVVGSVAVGAAGGISITLVEAE